MRYTRLNRILQVANLDPNKRRKNSNNLRVYWPGGIAPCMTSHTGNWVCPLVILISNKRNPIDASKMEYKLHPTKEDLIEYFRDRIDLRKITEREAMRLMDVDDKDIDTITQATETKVLKSGKTRTKRAIPKTAVFKMAGNSIVVSVLEHIFEKMFIQ